MLRVVEEALTFDDVLLVPAHSTVLPREVELKTRLTREKSLNIPLVSAALVSVCFFFFSVVAVVTGPLDGAASRGGAQDPAHAGDIAQHPAGVRRYGYGDRGAPRHRPRAGGRHRHHPQEYVGP